jgi:hypothetical protein
LTSYVSSSKINVRRFKNKIMKKIVSNYMRWKAALAFFLIIFAAQVLVVLPQASAATFDTTMVRLDRLAKSTATTGTVCAQTSTAAQTEGKVLLTFPAGFTVGSSGNWTTGVSTTGWPTGASAWPSIQSSGTAAGQVVTFTSGDLSTGTLYCFNWTNTAALTNPSSTGSKVITVDTQTGASAAIDSGTATSIVDTNCGAGSVPCDQIDVTATVNQSFTFSLSSNTAALSTLTTSNPVSATAINASVSTNAKSGWQMWAADPAGTPGLHSTTASKTIAYSPAAGSAASALSNGVEGYNIGAGNHTGTCNGSQTYGSGFDNTASTSYKGGGLDNTLRTVISSTSTANACAVPLTVNASISNTTPAATDYAGTITVVAAGLF